MKMNVSMTNQSFPTDRDGTQYCRTTYITNIDISVDRLTVIKILTDFCRRHFEEYGYTITADYDEKTKRYVIPTRPDLPDSKVCVDPDSHTIVDVSGVPIMFFREVIEPEKDGILRFWRFSIRTALSEEIMLYDICEDGEMEEYTDIPP